LRAPSFVFDRVGGDGEPLWPAGLTRSELDPYYAAVEANLPVTQLRWRHDDPAQAWRQVPRRGSVWAKAMGAAGHTVLPLRQAVQGCVHCGWCNAGCRFGAKRDVTKSYLPAAQRLGATLRSGVEVQLLVRPSIDGR
jgi:choline dehydrogenase-like flavoprotein